MCLGIPGRIVEITDVVGRLGVVDVGGVRRKVDLTCVLDPALAADPDAQSAALIGEWVLMHVGFAMSRIDEAEAARTLEALAALGEAEEEIAAMRAAETMLAEGAAPTAARAGEAAL